MRASIIYIILSTCVNAAIIMPTDGSILNHSQILVEWEQMPGVSTYLLTIDDISEGNQELIATTNKLNHLSNLPYKAYENSFQITVCDADDENNCSLSTFSLEPKIAN